MKTMIGCVVIFMSMLGTIAVASASPVVAAKDEPFQIQDEIDILKSFPVNKIKSAQVNQETFVYRKLPPIQFEKWLTSIMGDTPLEWNKESCASYDSAPDDNAASCTSLITIRTPQWRCPEINLRFEVWTDGAVYFLNDSSSVNDFGANGGMEQIAELQEALEKVKAKATPNRPSSLPAANLKAMTDYDLIRYVQTLDVHSLDPSLPSEYFGKWLGRTARWPMQWTQASALEEYDKRCWPKRLVIRVHSADTYDPRNRPPSADIMVDIGSWELGIAGEPKLTIFFEGPNNGKASSSYTTVKNLSELQRKFDEWNAAFLARKPIVSVPTKAPIVQNMTKLGYYSRIQATSGGHCYGIELSFWKYGERLFGTLYDLGGQCADSPEPTYIIRDVKYDAKTGNLEFWSYGTPGYKFVGTLDQNMVTGKFLGKPLEETVRLKRTKEDYQPNPDADKNVGIWCKDYAPEMRYIVKEELKVLCKSLGVQ